MDGKNSAKNRIRQKRQKWNKINGSKYNRWYKMVKKEGCRSLKKRWEESRWRRVARFKLENRRKTGGKEKKKYYASCVGEKKRYRNMYGRDVGQV